MVGGHSQHINETDRQFWQMRWKGALEQYHRGLEYLAKEFRID